MDSPTIQPEPELGASQVSDEPEAAAGLRRELLDNPVIERVLGRIQAAVEQVSSGHTKHASHSTHATHSSGWLSPKS
jgi:hypothetical protein